MKLTFQIEYITTWGEEIGVMPGGSNNEAIMLSTADGTHWEGSTEINAPANSMISYQYGVFCDGQCIRHESGTTMHLFCPGQANGNYRLADVWKELPAASYLFSSALSGNYQADGSVDASASIDGGITLRAISPCLRHKKQLLAVSGKCRALGYWNPKRVIPMTEVKPGEWMVTLKASELTFPLEYKFVACNKAHREVEEWEAHDNRLLFDPQLGDNESYLAPEEEVYFASSFRKVAGTAIPVFALRSEKSFGVGDFGDLKRLIDWAVATHQQAVQILPINDTTINHTWMDSYPYNSISIYAFHPMYLDLSGLGEMKNKEALATFEAKQKELNASPTVQYEEVNNTKRAYMRIMFKQDGKRVLASAAFKKFFKENGHWLLPYAAFSYLRDTYSTPDFRHWPEHQAYSAGEIAALCAPQSACYNEIAFYYYIQYHLHMQLLDAGNYARQKGIIFKGDIPIGISRNSVEAWIEPYYFNMNGQAGAPPDAFSTKGQNWGFPTYNWEVMEKDNYQWWQKRFRKMSEYFTAYRIDHILGFFRIWEIPAHSVHGLLGQFSPALPMSVSEIESYGLHFRKDFMTRPFINDDILRSIFGEKASYVKEHFVRLCHHDIYEMRPEFDTQRKVEKWFEGKNDGESVNLREGLYALISNVLFVPDRRDPSMYHPRIAVQNDFIYERLSGEEKESFNRLYNHYYYKRHNQFWYQEAMKKLPVLTQATPMLVCGEDLGMVPDCVQWVMEQLQILSLEIQRMPKNPEHAFGHVGEYPYRSVCTISSHDTSTLRGWWEENYGQTCRYYNQELGHGGDAPKAAPGWICEEIVRRHLESPSLLCILTLQDWLSIDEALRNPDVEGERINVPANPRHYWRYRMHITLEELMANDKFNSRLRAMIESTGRGK